MQLTTTNNTLGFQHQYKNKARLRAYLNQIYTENKIKSGVHLYQIFSSHNFFFLKEALTTYLITDNRLDISKRRSKL